MGEGKQNLIIFLASLLLILLVIMVAFSGNFQKLYGTESKSELKFEINGERNGDMLTFYIENLNDFDVHNIGVSINAYCKSSINTELANSPIHLQKSIGDIGKRGTATVIFTSGYAYDFYKYTITIGTSEGSFTCELQ